MIELARLPLAEGVAEVAAAAGRDALRLAASGGEDYELLAAIAPAALEPARRDAPCPLTPVGRLEQVRRAWSRSTPPARPWSWRPGVGARCLSPSARRPSRPAGCGCAFGETEVLGGSP